MGKNIWLYIFQIGIGTGIYMIID